MAGKPDGARVDREGRARALAALVAELGSVSAACRTLGLDRSAWYRIRKAEGSDSQSAGPPRRNATPTGVAEAVLRLCLEYPEWGCDRIAHYLTLEGRPVSSPTVQKILVRAGLGRVRQREKEAARRKAGSGGNV